MKRARIISPSKGGPHFSAIPKWVKVGAVVLPASALGLYFYSSFKKPPTLQSPRQQKTSLFSLDFATSKADADAKHNFRSSNYTQYFDPTGREFLTPQECINCHTQQGNGVVPSMSGVLSALSARVKASEQEVRKTYPYLYEKQVTAVNIDTLSGFERKGLNSSMNAVTSLTLPLSTFYAPRLIDSSTSSYIIPHELVHGETQPPSCRNRESWAHAYPFVRDPKYLFTLDPNGNRTLHNPHVNAFLQRAVILSGSYPAHPTSPDGKFTYNLRPISEYQTALTNHNDALEAVGNIYKRALKDYQQIAHQVGWDAAMIYYENPTINVDFLIAKHLKQQGLLDDALANGENLAIARRIFEGNRQLKNLSDIKASDVLNGFTYLDPLYHFQRSVAGDASPRDKILMYYAAVYTLFKNGPEKAVPKNELHDVAVTNLNSVKLAKNVLEEAITRIRKSPPKHPARGQIPMLQERLDYVSKLLKVFKSQAKQP